MELKTNNLRSIIRKIILKESKSLKEQEENNFNRVNFYLEYYTNNSPSSFKVVRDGDSIKILNII
jgi:iron uptake system EfeUOB component EfeO/EfeM